MIKQWVYLLLNDISKMKTVFDDLCSEGEQHMMKLKRLSVKKYEVMNQILGIDGYGHT